LSPELVDPLCTLQAEETQTSRSQRHPASQPVGEIRTGAADQASWKGKSCVWVWCGVVSLCHFPGERREKRSLHDMQNSMHWSPAAFAGYCQGGKRREDRPLIGNFQVQNRTATARALYASMPPWEHVWGDERARMIWPIEARYPRPMQRQPRARDQQIS